MRLFRKQDKGNRAPAAWILQVLSGVEGRQRKVAAYLARRTQYWNRSSWLVALAVFILLFGGCCVYLCIKAFIHFN